MINEKITPIKVADFLFEVYTCNCDLLLLYRCTDEDVKDGICERAETSVQAGIVLSSLYLIWMDI